MNFMDALEKEYQKLILDYHNKLTETTLYRAQKYSRKTIEHQVPPEEIISIHKKVIQNLFPEVDANILDSFDILLEVMVGYGLAYQEHQDLRDIQQEIRSEIEIASNIQQTLLKSEVPNIDGLDIGVVSQPAKKINGDYYHFVHDEDKISIGIADVIGKGIPAALCMSMIKYAMDSLPESRKNPGQVLENLNRVVEQNVDPSMFITMFYGIYHVKNNLFTYASAGHEPGFFYDASTNEFYDLKAKGLVLGVDEKSKYRQYEKQINCGDMIILLSDGVTELKVEEEFIERSFITDLIRKYSNLPAQEIADKIFSIFLGMQNLELRDDFTLIIFRKNV